MATTAFREARLKPCFREHNLSPTLLLASPKKLEFRQLERAGRVTLGVEPLGVEVVALLVDANCDTAVTLLATHAADAYVHPIASRLSKKFHFAFRGYCTHNLPLKSQL